MNGWRIAAWATVMLLILLFLYLVRSILLPFMIVFLIATLLEPLIQKVRLRGVSRPLSVLAVLVPFYLVMILALAFLVPKIAEQVVGASTEITNYVNASSNTDTTKPSSMEVSIDKFLSDHSGLLKKYNQPTTLQGLETKYIEPQKKQISSYLETTFGSFFGVLGSVGHQAFSVVIIFIGVPLLLMDLESYKRNLPRLFPPSIRKQSMALLDDLGDVFVKYLRGVSTVVLLYMASASILLSIFGVPYAIICGLVFGVFYLIPLFGNLIAYLTLFLIIGLTETHGSTGLHINMSSPWAYAGVVLGVYALMGMTFDQLVYPQLVGSAVGLSGVVNLFVILSGATLFGVVGMIIAFPLAGSMKIILDRALKFSTKSQDELNLPIVPLRHRHSIAANS